jgi:hypothetical protein
MSLAALHLTNIVTSLFRSEKSKTFGATITHWKLTVASIFEFKASNQKKINHKPSKFQWKNQRRSGKKKLTLEDIPILMILWQLL